MKGITIANCASPVSTVPGTENGNSSSLIMTGGNSEIIKYRYRRGVNGIFPTVEEHDVVETYIMLGGSIVLEFPDKTTRLLKKDDALRLEYGSETITFKVTEDCEMLLVTNYHPYYTDIQRDASLIKIMEKLQEADGDTLEHCIRVRDLAMKIALATGVKGDTLNCLFYAARFHDVGKSCIPKDILIKPAKLDDTEYEIMKGHSKFSSDLVRPYFGKDIAYCVLCHHERPDGRGYPNGLGRINIPETSKIISVADSFDAMITVRPYNKGRTPVEAMNELYRCVGTQFEEEYVEALNSHLRESHKI